ncbi:hypothetical protein F887_02621 [Acinetobacter sp. NIPH 2100]|nr:hypothetical protein F887_02621 [Acinetobacter sp. NIPH 2100]
MKLVRSELKVNKKSNGLNVFQNQKMEMKNHDRKHFYLPNRG